MIDIATIGWLTVDDIVLTDGTCRMAVRGGGALYSAVGARLWSDGVGIHSVAGRPHFTETRRQIQARGIDVAGVGQTDGNGLELWLLHESEVHKQQVPKLSSTNAIELDAMRGPLPDAYAGARAFHIAPQGPESGLANAKRLAALAQRPVLTMDILADDFIDASAYRDLDFLSQLTAFLPSEAEIERIWRPTSIEGWLIQNAETYGCHMVAKLGERGSLVCEARTGALTHVPALSAHVVDTTGAGDGYCGGFVAGLVAGRPLVTCAAMATVSASYIVEACGALATLQPTKEERNDRLVHALSAARPFPHVI
ncbi:MAG TPA: PfkB family carbohydrate kinase [Roseiarcus sp.]